ncbi:MAG: hypothetical protein M0008_06640 [Actinomycetota bacterium]|nr:hypothetical protein [Actinomycetota bacterium]
MHFATACMAANNAQYDRLITGQLRHHLLRRTAILGAVMASALALSSCGTNSSPVVKRTKPLSLSTQLRTTRMSASPASAVTDGRFVRPVTIGGLRIAKAPPSMQAAPLGLDLAEAKRYVGLTGGLLPGRQVVGYGLVTLTGVATPTGTLALVARPAWVGIVLPSAAAPYAVNCPAETIPQRPSPSSPLGSARPAFHAIEQAVVFYGQGGRGALLYSTGGSLPCGAGTIGPRASTADALASVAWQKLGPTSASTTISYKAPVCSILQGVSSNGNVHTWVITVNVTVSFPFNRTGCRAVKRFTTTFDPYPPSSARQSPPGNVTLLHSPAPAFTPPELIGVISAK